MGLFLQLWDVRTKTTTGFGNNGGKVYAMDAIANRVIIGTSERKIVVWDVRNLEQPEQIRDSPLKVNLLIKKASQDKLNRQQLKFFQFF